MGDRFRLDRGSLWTAVIAALAWLLSGALNAALTWFDVGFPASVVRLIFPGTVASSAWHAPLPWPIVIVAFSMLTVMGLTVALTLLAAPYAGTLRHSVRIDLDIVDAGPWQ
jgi:hypothetical protein